MIEYFEHILSLGEKETRGSVLNVHSKKVIQLSEIFQGEHMLECTNDPLKQGGRGCCEDNVVNI
jgi:hypothetical protein